MKLRMLALIGVTGSIMFAAPGVFAGGETNYAPVQTVAYLPPPPPPVAGVVPPAPGRGYAWVGGYYSPMGSRWAWHRGYWARPPYPHARWMAPRYNHGRYYRGYWR